MFLSTTVSADKPLYERNKDYTIDYAKGTIIRTPFGTIRDMRQLMLNILISLVQSQYLLRTPFCLDIYNSSPHAAKKVLYAIPTFGWECKHEVEGKKSRGKVVVYKFI